MDPVALDASVEREIKFDVSSDFRLAALNLDAPNLEILPPAVKELDAIYFDTADLRLARCGITLRHRSGESRPWTLKLPDRGSGGELARLELRAEGNVDSVPDDFSYIVAGYSAAAPLVSAIRLRSHRHVVQLVTEGAELAVELVDDVVTVTGLGEEAISTQFREVEVEFTESADPECVRAIVGDLEAAGAIRSNNPPKAIRALGPAAALAPAIPFAELPPDGTAEETAAAVLQRAVATLLARDLEVRAKLEPDLAELATLIVAIRWVVTWLAPLLGPMAGTLLDHVLLLGAELQPDTRKGHVGERLSASYSQALAALTRAVENY